MQERVSDVAGKSLELVCEAAGSPSPTITWTHASTLITPEHPRYQVSCSCTLSLPHLWFDHSFGTVEKSECVKVFLHNHKFTNMPMCVKFILNSIAFLSLWLFLLWLHWLSHSLSLDSGWHTETKKKRGTTGRRRDCDVFCPKPHWERLTQLYMMFLVRFINTVLYRWVLLH